MNRDSVGTGAALGGTALLAACSCGVATGTVGLLGVAGVETTNPTVHPFLTAPAVALIVLGLAQRGREPALWAGGAAAALVAGASLAPPSSMTLDNIPHQGAGLLGLWLYLAAAGFLVMAFYQAYRPPARGGLLAMGGLAAAVGCSCCLVTGALAGILGSAGLGMPWIYSEPVIFWTAVGGVTFGLFRMAGWRAAWLAPAGALVVWGGPQVLRLMWPEMPFHDVNMRFLPAYLVMAGGIGMILYGFVVAYRETSRSDPLLLPAEPEPEEVTLPFDADGDDLEPEPATVPE